MRRFGTIIVLLLVSVSTGIAAETPSLSFDETLDRAIARERSFIATMRGMQPLAETYIQNLREGNNHGLAPVNDQYFLGRVSFNDALRDSLFKAQREGLLHHLSTPISSTFSSQFLARGFAQMAILDGDFRKDNYQFSFVRREFLGEVRCLVIDVQPKNSAVRGLFRGRIWVEERGFNIVRFNGTYSGSSPYKGYLHFDSWRFNLQGDVWLPSCIYAEESAKRSRTRRNFFFKAQTRFWAYDAQPLNRNDQFTQIKVDNSVEDRSIEKDNDPLEAQRMWERMAEDNALDHLQRVGLVAPAGDVDSVLQTVINNLVISNKLEIQPEVRCRVLLTLPFESFTIGHTVIVSRGLLDALPDEASLAAILAHEIAHITSGQRIDTRFAFNDRFFFPDTQTFQRLDFEQNVADEKAADIKAVELLANSPYKNKLSSAGAFFQALHDRSGALGDLIKPRLGNRMVDHNNVRMAELVDSAGSSENSRIDQIAALPVGSRIKLDPWSNQISMMNTSPATFLSETENMPFEITAFHPVLRYSQTDRKLIAENPLKQ